MFRKLAASGIAAVAALAVVPAAPALADEQEEYAFVQFMHSRDIDDYYPDPKRMVTAGVSVCDAMDEDRYTWQQATMKLMSADAIPVDKATFMVFGAALAFCPWHLRQ